VRSTLQIDPETRLNSGFLQYSDMPEFPSGTVFADVEGVPVSRDPEFNCTAWDVPDGRRFSAASFAHNGTLISEDRFRELVSWEQPCPLDAEPY
jgi:hypothetical protein